MAIAITVTQEHNLGDVLMVRGTFVFSGTYPTGGEVLTGFAGLVKSTLKALDMLIHGKGGFVYTYDEAANKVQVFVNTAGGANAPLGEHTAAGYVGGVSGDVVSYVAYFKKFL